MAFSGGLKQAMQEILRQEYLSNIGIDSYFPKVVLPGAKASEQYEWQDEELAASFEGNQQSLDQSTLSSDKVEQAKISADFPLKQTNNKPLNDKALRSNIDEAPRASESEAKPEETTEAASEVRFQLVFAQINQDLLVAAVLPHFQSGGAFKPQQKQLLKNLCRAFGFETDAINYEIKAFRWPLIEAAHMDKSKDAAKSSLKAYLSQLAVEFQYRTLLLMSENIASLVHVDSDCQLIVCRSLDEMLKMPKLKREVWLALKQSTLSS